MDSERIKTYCLGTGCMEKCRSCQHDANWQTLNQLPDALRLSIQRQALRVNESSCQITSGRFYLAKVAT